MARAAAILALLRIDPIPELPEMRSQTTDSEKKIELDTNSHKNMDYILHVPTSCSSDHWVGQRVDSDMKKIQGLNSHQFEFPRAGNGYSPN